MSCGAVCSRSPVSFRRLEPQGRKRTGSASYGFSFEQLTHMRRDILAEESATIRPALNGRFLRQQQLRRYERFATFLSL